MDPATALFYDTDTQRDFILPGGNLYVPGAESILPRLEELTRLARQKGIAVAGSVDRHFPYDAELQPNGGAYPEHCMAGTEGQKKVAATLPQRPVWIENRDYTETELKALLQQGGEIYIEKQDVDLFVGNRNAAYVLDTLLQGKEDVVVYGVVTEICVDLALAALKERAVRLHVPVDAIAALSEEKGKEAMEKWRHWGVRLTTVAEVTAELGGDVKRNE
jgi:nicotinamidase/pyrazinamidase